MEGDQAAEGQAPEATASTAPETGLETRVDSLEAKVDQILGLVSGGRENAAEPPSQGGGTNVAHEIRQQLDERDARARAQADEAAKADRLGAIETKLAELAEKPPEPMPRRIERIMGWR